MPAKKRRNPYHFSKIKILFLSPKFYPRNFTKFHPHPHPHPQHKNGQKATK